MQTSTITTQSTNWSDLASRILDGHQLTREAGLAILGSPDEQLLDLLAATYRIRQRHFGNAVHLYKLENAKSGLCPEDCGYCSQSKLSTASIDKYPLQAKQKLLAGAKQAVDSRARTYCIVASGRGPTNREVDQLCETVREIKDEHGLHICCCLGLLTPEQARQLKDAGVDRINHNLNTSRRFYDEICTTHTFDERLQTLRTCRDAGLELCCGLIVGMGEEASDLVDVAFELRELNVESIPINFLNAIDGTPLQGLDHINPRDCLRALCLFRMMHPQTEIRIAGGREIKLRSLQPLGLYAANSLFVSDYLTTKGQTPDQDYQMIEDLGFTIVHTGSEIN